MILNDPTWKEPEALPRLPPMSTKPFDVTLKELIEEAAAAWPELLGPWPFRRVEIVDADLSTVVAAADKVMRVYSDDYDWLLHVEAQAGHGLGLPERIFEYNTLLRRRHRLLVRSVVLLLRREANASDLTGVLELQFPDEDIAYTVFRYRVVRLWELPVQKLLAADPRILPLAPLTDEAAAALPSVMGRIDERLRQEVPPEEADKLRTATFVLLGLRYPPEVAGQLLRGITSMEESATYQYIVSKGELKEARKFLMRQGCKRFGQPDPTIVATIESITDVERLEQLGERLLEVSSWQELLAGP
jgi:predicted transposase YdaD